MNRTDLINYRAELINLVISKLKLKSYCEIGVAGGRNFAAINCRRKVGVDPDTSSKATVFKTSDDFFEHNTEMFDCFFLDGFHHAEQLRQDLINSWKFLNPYGVCFIHDTNPDREEITHVPRDSKEWCGDCYKAIHQIDGPPKFTLKDDHGVTVIRKTGPLVMSDGVIEWDGFIMFREVILHLVTWEEAIKIIDGWE